MRSEFETVLVAPATSVHDVIGDLQRYIRLHGRLFGMEAPAFKVGRYELGIPVGKGAAGLVHRGYDPLLDRSVAIKLVPSPGGSATSSHSLMAEAQTLGALDHPNLVQIHDAGVCSLMDIARTIPVPAPLALQEVVYLVMELLEGPSLSQWLKGGPSPRQIVRHFAAMGEALAAAHAANVVHRDFKPSNVVFDLEGRPRVLDFGLAHASAIEGGSVVGTPPYMAPEQHEGRAEDPRVDQFSFCVALWEALAGRRPFKGPSLNDLYAQKHRLDLENATRVLPRNVRGVLLRGLQSDPRKRFPDMAALVHALRRPERNRRMVRRSSVGALLLASASVLTIVASGPGETSSCEPGEGHETSFWTRSAQSRLNEGFRSAEDPHSRDALDLVQRRFAGLDLHWQAQHRQACAMQEGPEREAMLECLDNADGAARGVLAAIVQRPGPHAVNALELLLSPRACSSADPERPIASSSMEEHIENRARILLGEAQSVITRANEKLESTKQLSAREQMLWTMLRGMAYYAEGRGEDSRRDLERAWALAENVGDNMAVVRILLTLSNLSMATDRNPGEALSYIRAAESRRPKLGRRGRIMLAGARANYHLSTDGQLDECIKHAYEAIALYRELDPDSRFSVRATVGLTRLMLAEALIRRGDLERADHELRKFDSAASAPAGSMILDTNWQTTVAFWHWQRGDLTAARQRIDQAIASGAWTNARFRLLLSVRIAIDEGYLDEVSATLDAFARGHLVAAESEAPHRSPLATLDLHRGRLSAVELDDSSDPVGIGRRVLALARAIERGDPSTIHRAQLAIEDALPLLDEHEVRELRADVGDMMSLEGDVAALAGLARLAERAPTPLHKARSHLIVARGLLFTGLDEEAGPHVRAAARTLQLLEEAWPLGEIELSVLQAILHCRAGREAAASELVRAAMARRRDRASLSLARSLAVLATASHDMELAQQVRMWIRGLGDELGADSEIIERLTNLPPHTTRSEEQNSDSGI